MTDTILPSQASSSILADRALKASAQLWFIIAATGQIIFITYVILYFGGAVFPAGIEGLNDTHLTGGYIPGDTMGNITVASHLLLAVTITLGGILQLIPQIRAYAPTFHRWNGRVYIFTAIIISLGGLFMVWTRGTVGDLSQHISISLNAVFIIICAALALRYAMARKFAIHRRWALRLFLVVNGVWFFRVGLMLWLTLNQGPVGIDFKTFTGPFLTFLAFAQFLLPLLFLEVYFYAQSSTTRTSHKAATASLLVILSLLTGLGIFAATMGLWISKF